MVPQHLACEIAPRQIFAEREVAHPHVAHGRPVRDPGPRLPRRSHGRRAECAAAPAHAAPDARAGQPTHDRAHRAQVADGVGGRGRHPARAQKAAQRVLVLAALDRPCAGQEEAPAEARALPRDRAHVAIRRGDHEVHALARDEAAQARRERAIAGRRQQVVPVSRRLLEVEPVVVTAQHDERLVRRSQAADQVVAEPGPGAGHEDADRPVPASAHDAATVSRVDGGAVFVERRLAGPRPSPPARAGAGPDGCRRAKP